MEQENSSIELAGLQNRRRAWFKHFLIWQWISWFLLVLISAGSAVVASQVLNANDSQPKMVMLRNVIALIVAVASALLAALQPQQRAKSYRQAWIEIDLALKGAAKVPAELIEAIRRGENLIGDAHAEGSAETEP